MDAPKTKEQYLVIQSNFLGVDFQNAPANVASGRSPMCVNMIRETVGNNRKRHGYETVATLSGQVNGIFNLKTPTLNKTVIHAGTKIYDYNTETDTATIIYQNANNHLSQARQMGSKLYIQDKADILVYDGSTVKSISDDAYIPWVTIAKSPTGGGTSNEAVNLITPKREESFIGDATSLTYQLGAVNIDSATVQINLLNEQGGYTPLEELTDFIVNRTLGTITFNEAHQTPVDGHDNIYVTYSKTISGYADRIKNCDISILYGANGLRDRMFVAGNDNYPNYDWYCASDDPTYWGDIWYSVLGQNDSEIIGYSILNGVMLVHKASQANDSNIITRTGSYDTDMGQVVFRTTGNYEAAPALGKYTFQTMKNEPLYLAEGAQIHAVTATDVIGERMSQERSYYISPALDKEDKTKLKNAYSAKYGDFYLLAVDDKVYILDTAQYSYNENAPYSTRQYECYYWTGIGARVIKTINDRLYFGTSDGKLKRFFNSDVGGFTDDGVTTQVTKIIDGVAVTTTESFPCYWETDEIWNGSSSRVSHQELKKTFKHLAVALNAYPHTGCRIWANIDGIWEIIFDYDATASYIDFNDIDFNDFSFRTDDTATIVGGKFKGKKLLHIQFRFENSKPQPFSVLWAKAKYTVGNNYRK